MRILRPLNAAFSIALALVVGTGLAFIGVASGLTLWPGILVGLLILWLGTRRSVRRLRAVRRGLSPSDRAWIEDNVPFYQRLARDAKRRFLQDVVFVLDEWLFESVGGVAVTRELKLSVAAGVATLLHGRPEWEISSARTILFYPEQFDEDYQADEEGNYDGMAHAQGPVILSAPAVEVAWQTASRGSNVVLHELAHLFDFANTFADGITSLIDPGSVDAWEELVRKEMHRIRFGRSILRKYGAKDRAEFFAVAVENFYGRPEVLAHHHPELFNALCALLNVDPRDPKGSQVVPDDDLTKKAPTVGRQPEP